MDKPVGQDSRTWWRSWIRRTQTCQRPQAPYFGRYLRTTHCLQSEPADISDRRAASLLLGGLSPLFPNIRIVIADGGHQSRRLTQEFLKQAGWTLQIVKRRQRKFEITGLSLDCPSESFAWLRRNRCFQQGLPGTRVQNSPRRWIEIAALRLML